MNRRLALLLVLGVAACKNSGAASSSDAGVTTTSASADSCAPFVEKMLAFQPGKDVERDRKAFAVACGAASKAARACVEKAPGKDAIDKCLEGEKMQIAGAVFAAAAAEKEAKDKLEAAKPPAPVKLPKLGVQLDIRGEAKIDKSMFNDGNEVTSASTGMLIVSESSKGAPQTIERAKASAITSRKAKAIDSGALPEGYWLTYDYEDFGNTTTTKVVVRRRLDKKTYECESWGRLKPAQVSAALEACKTLRL